VSSGSPELHGQARLRCHHTPPGVRIGSRGVRVPGHPTDAFRRFDLAPEAADKPREISFPPVSSIDLVSRHSLPRHRSRRQIERSSRPLWLGVPIFVTVVLVSSGIVGCGDYADKRARAQRDIERIAFAIKAYRLRHPKGRLPEMRDCPAVLLAPDSRGNPPLLDPDMLTAGQLLDPWGTEYVYVQLDGSTFEALSYGADGVGGGDGEDADITTEKPRK
jgi:general secretion pathway protein G